MSNTIQWRGLGVELLISLEPGYAFDEVVTVTGRLAGRKLSRSIERRHINETSVANAVYELGSMSPAQADALAPLVVALVVR